MVVYNLLKSRFPVFALGGTTCFLYEVILTWLLTDFAGYWYFGSYLFSLATGTIFLFIYHMMVTFKKLDRKGRRFAKFIFVICVYIYLNLHLVYILTESYNLHYLISVVVVTSTLSIFNFVLNRYWVFRTYAKAR